MDLTLRTYESYTFHGLGAYGGYDVTLHSYTTGGVNNTDYVLNCMTASYCKSLLYTCTLFSIDISRLQFALEYHLFTINFIDKVNIYFDQNKVKLDPRNCVCDHIHISQEVCLTMTTLRCFVLKQFVNNVSSMHSIDTLRHACIIGLTVF